MKKIKTILIGMGNIGYLNDLKQKKKFKLIIKLYAKIS